MHRLQKITGQGLDNSYDVTVERYQGSITVESTPGEGMIFRIRLLLKEVEIQ